MNRTELLLTLLNEECVETAQRVTKALRFTLDEVQTGQSLSNAERIVYEFNDILAVMEVLEEEGILKNVRDPEMIEKKKDKIKKYIEYSKKMGVLD